MSFSLSIPSYLLSKAKARADLLHIPLRDFLIVSLDFYLSLPLSAESRSVVIQQFLDGASVVDFSKAGAAATAPAACEDARRGSDATSTPPRGKHGETLGDVE